MRGDRRWLAAVVVALAGSGCGLLLELDGAAAGTGGPGSQDASTNGSLDGSASDGAAPDAGADGAAQDAGPVTASDGGAGVRCPPATWQPFEGPEPLATVNSSCSEMGSTCREEAPQLSPDGARMWLLSNRDTGLLSPYHAERMEPGMAGSAFASPLAWETVDGEPWGDIAGDERRPLVRSIIRDGCAALQIWDGTTTRWRSDWISGSGKNDYNAWLSRDELRLYFASTRDDGEPGCGTHEQLYWTVRESPSAPFAEAERLVIALPEAAGAVTDAANPTLTADELTLVFNALAVERANTVYVATRSTADEAFVEATAVPFAEAPPSLQYPAISPDGCELFAVVLVSGDRDIVRYVQPM